MTTRDNGTSWVTPRFKCTLDDQYCSVIRRIKADVAEFNELAGKTQFDATQNADDTLSVLRWVYPEGDRANHDMDDQIVVKCTGETILARRKRRLLVEAAPRWNTETLTCDLIVEGEAMTIWQISQMILGDFLFGPVGGDQ